MHLRPVVAILVAGSLGFICYELWLFAQEWAKKIFLSDFPFLAGLGAIIAFLSLAELALSAFRRLISGRDAALHDPP